MAGGREKRRRSRLVLLLLRSSQSGGFDKRGESGEGFGGLDESMLFEGKRD